MAALSPQSPQKCNLEYYQAIVHNQTSLVTVKELKTIMNERVNMFTVSTTKQFIGLCREHYQQMYGHIHHAAAFDSCGAKPKKGEAYTRNCPSPSIVNGYLSHISIETSALTSSSTIYLSCYK